MSTQITRKGSGRTKGSFSFAPITLEQLNKHFADKQVKVVCSRKFLEAAGFTGLQSGAATTLTATIEAATPSAVATVQTEDLND